MDSFTPIIALSFVAFTIINFLRFLRGRDWNGAFTIAAVWVAGFVASWLLAASEIGETLVLPLTGGVPLGDLGAADLVVLGLIVGSTATAVNEFRGAIDQHSSTVKPSLLPDHVTHTTHEG